MAVRPFRPVNPPNNGGVIDLVTAYGPSVINIIGELWDISIVYTQILTGAVRLPKVIEAIKSKSYGLLACSALSFGICFFPNGRIFSITVDLTVELFTNKKIKSCFENIFSRLQNKKTPQIMDLLDPTILANAYQILDIDESKKGDLGVITSNYEEEMKELSGKREGLLRRGRKWMADQIQLNIDNVEIAYQTIFRTLSAPHC